MTPTIHSDAPDASDPPGDAPAGVSSDASADAPAGTPLVDVSVENPEARCPYCERPFPREHLRALHVGEVHADACTDPEREAYEAARDDESAELFVFHVKVIAALSVTYTVFVLAYMVALTYGV